MLEEALVFDGSDGIHQDLGDVVELHHAPLFARRPGDRLDQLRFQLVLIARRIVLQGDDLRDLAVGETDQAGFLVEVGIGLREDLDGVRVNLVVAHRVAAGFGVARAAQVGGDVVGSDRIAHRNRFGRGKNLGGIGKNAGAELLVDDAGVARVKVGEGAQAGDDEKRKQDDEDASGRAQNQSRHAAAARDAQLHLLLAVFFVGLRHYF